MSKPHPLDLWASDDPRLRRLRALELRMIAGLLQAKDDPRGEVALENALYLDPPMGSA